MRMPSAYANGHRSARALDPGRADNYVSHTLIGDPAADELLAELAPLGQAELGRLIQIGMGGGEPALQKVPAVLREFFHSCSIPPEWLDLSGHAPGIRMFHRNSALMLGAMVAGTLVEGFATNIAKSFFITGKIRDQGIRRLKQNNRHMVEIFLPGGLDRDGDGWKLSVRIRLVHAMVRRLLNESEDWDQEAWGTPVSAAHTGFAITAFSARSLIHLKSLGARFTDEERASFMQVWRYSGHLMGVPATILFRDEADALRTFEIGLACEPDAGLESISLANALVNSSPLIAGVTEPADRRKLAHYVYRISRALIGPGIADQLMFPRYPTYGVLWWFRMQNRYDDLMNRVFTSRGRKNNQLSAMLEVSTVDESGIAYRLPDHVYAEESSRW